MGIADPVNQINKFSILFLNIQKVLLTELRWGNKRLDEIIQVECIRSIIGHDGYYILKVKKKCLTETLLSTNCTWKMGILPYNKERRISKDCEETPRMGFQPYL